MSIEVRYIYSACVVVKTPDVSILCDPWFTEGVYDGSWFHFPQVSNPLQLIGNVDYIYVSHIHPDHYDPGFLRQFFKEYGVKKILIADHNPNYLEIKIKTDGFEYLVMPVSKFTNFNNTKISVLPHKTGSISDIDSAIVIQFSDGVRQHCVVNANDVIFNSEMRSHLKQIAGDVDILLCGYTGAGPYPQTYFSPDDPEIKKAATQKKEEFLNRYLTLVSEMKAKVNIPFAGKYILGGRLAVLNDHRGVADPTEVLAIDPNAVVLEDFIGSIETALLKPNKTRTTIYDPMKISMRIQEIAHHRMDYENWMNLSFVDKLPLLRLLRIAAKNAIKKSEVDSDYFFCFDLGEKKVIINANKNKNDSIYFALSVELPIPRSEISIDPRYLFGLLTHVYHWNNAETGSQFMVRRVPNVFNSAAQKFLNFLSV